jgi:putative transposase
MRKSKCSEAQVAFILRESEESLSIDEACGNAQVSEVMFYVLRRKYGG